MYCSWTARLLFGTTPYMLINLRSLDSAALAFFMVRLCCSLNVRCASIQTLSQDVAGMLNPMIPFLTLNYAVSWGKRFFLRPCLHVNGAASVFAASKCSPPLLAHSMLCAVHLSSIVTTWLTSVPVAIQLEWYNMTALRLLLRTLRPI
jgi:hypothetical protein